MRNRRRFHSECHLEMDLHLSEGSRFFLFLSLVDSFRWAFFSQHCGDDGFYFEFDCEAPRLESCCMEPTHAYSELFSIVQGAMVGQ